MGLPSVLFPSGFPAQTLYTLITLLNVSFVKIGKEKP
jgi:hypothetical protein